MLEEKTWYLYMLRCSGNLYYTGISPDVKKRVLAHKSGKGARFTKIHPPLELVYVEPIGTIGSALKTERAYKRMPRGKKEMIVQSFQQQIPSLTDPILLDFLSVNEITI